MTHTKEDVLLRAEGINLSFPGKVVLREVNFEVRDIRRPDVLQGQVVSLIGRSGIGKTQLFRILAGLQRPDSGRVLVDKEQRPVRPGDMGVVPQNYFLFPWRKVKTILELAAAKNPALKKEDRAAFIQEHVAGFALEEHLNKYPMQLSGGQRQRVSIIQQLVNGSNFLLLDEPFSGLDAIAIRQVTAVLQKVSRQDEVKTLVIVSHDLESTLAVSDTALVLAREEGKEGATITRTIDLIERDLAWQPDIRQRPEFAQLVADIEAAL